MTDSPAGYRPISLLSVVSKMLEHHYHAFIMSHLSAVSPLALNQWGFQSRKSTVSALLSVVHRLHLSLEDGQEVAVIFYDLKEAFLIYLCWLSCHLLVSIRLLFLGLLAI